MAVVESNHLEGPAILLRTEIRGSTVTACWHRGLLTGDDELIRRVTNLAIWQRIDLAELTPVQLINLAREACAAPIETEVLLSDADVRTDLASRPRRSS